MMGSRGGNGDGRGGVPMNGGRFMYRPPMYRPDFNRGQRSRNYFTGVPVKAGRKIFYYSTANVRILLYCTNTPLLMLGYYCTARTLHC